MKKTLKKLCLLIAAAVLIPVVVSCSSDDDKEVTEQSLAVKEQEEYSKFMTPKMEESVKQLGAEIHRGINPPDISGYYLFETNCVRSTIYGDAYVGSLINHYKIKLYDKIGLKINMLGYEVKTGTDIFIATHTANGTFITGTENNFSIFFEEEAKSDDGFTTTALTILSGEVDRNEKGGIKGLKNIQYVYLMKENNGRPYTMPNGSGRLFKDDYADVISKEKFETIIKNKKAANKTIVSLGSIADIQKGL